jgi:hypothetical protein
MAFPISLNPAVARATTRAKGEDDGALLAVHSFSFTNASRRDLKSDASINRIRRAVRDFTD